MPNISRLFMLIALAALMLSACQAQPNAEIANPASTYCIEQGGTLTILKNGAGNEYGVCQFENKYQCEEWALFRGECPEGGVDIQAYVSTAAAYCAISGGEYAITAYSGDPEREDGTCTFESGNTCNVWEFYNEKCTK